MPAGILEEVKEVMSVRKVGSLGCTKISPTDALLLTRIPTSTISYGAGGFVDVYDPEEVFDKNNRSPIEPLPIVFNPLTEPYVVTYPDSLFSISSVATPII